MAAIHIRDVSNEILEALKRRAQRHDRSLQGELRHILAAMAEEEPVMPLPPLKLHFSNECAQTNWSREEIYDDDGR